MIAAKDNQISVYEGNYRPVQVMQNGKQLAGWKTVGMTEAEGEFIGTYNDFLTIYGKSGYRKSVNLCPPPTTTTENDGVLEMNLTTCSEGRFDLSVTTVSNDVVMMMSPMVIHSVTLPAGIYTASSNSANLGYCPGDESCYDLPHTFTLTKEQTVDFGTYSTGFSETGLYLQVEAGETVTDYDPYAGDPTKDPSPDNIRPLSAAQGTITTQGKDLLAHPHENHTYSIPELRGIEVDVAAPYNYLETLDGATHYYISDVLCENAITRYVGAVILDGSEPWVLVGADASLRAYIVLRSKEYGVCSHFSLQSAQNPGGFDLANIYLRFNLWGIATSVEEWKQYLSDQYQKGTPVTVYYVQQEPTIENMDAASLKTYAQYTKISVSNQKGSPKIGMSKCIRVGMPNI